MNITDLNWWTDNEGETWTYSAYVSGSDNRAIRRKLFDVAYAGRARGGGPQRWVVYDRRYWVDQPDDIPEFAHVYEAKAWVEVIVRMTT